MSVQLFVFDSLRDGGLHFWNQDAASEQLDLINVSEGKTSILKCGSDWSGNALEKGLALLLEFSTSHLEGKVRVVEQLS